MLNRLLTAGLLAAIVWISILSHPASSQQIDSRLNILEFDLRRLETRLNQIELQLGQNHSQRSPLTSSQSSGSRRSLSVSERDRMFDRLATLVIELKQQVHQLTTRVKKLELR